MRAERIYDLYGTRQRRAPETFYGVKFTQFPPKLYDSPATRLSRALVRIDIFDALMRYVKPRLMG